MESSSEFVKEAEEGSLPGETAQTVRPLTGWETIVFQLDDDAGSGSGPEPR